jgi:proteic killer suppression protein
VTVIGTKLRSIAVSRQKNVVLQGSIDLAIHNAARYYLSMIKSFRCKETKRIFEGRFSKRFPPDIQKRARMRLERIDAAAVLEDLRVPPSHHLEALSWDRQCQHSIRINGQWHVCFVWQDGSACNVEITDYH